MIKILLVTYNRINSLKEILKNIKVYNWPFDEFIIINNNSSDGTTEYLNIISRNYTIINLKENIGHGSALAKGIKKIMTDENYIKGYTIFLEDDSIPKESLFYKLKNYILNSKYDFISSAGQLVKLGKRIEIFPVINELIEVDFCLFDGAIIKNIIFKQVGFHEEKWFMMFDDFEYCYRVKKNGYKIAIVHNDFHKILHFGGGGLNRSSAVWRGYYQSRNHLFFLKKHFNLFNLFDFIILNFKRLFGCLLASDNKLLRFNLRILGLYHGLVGKKGESLDISNLRLKK